MAQKPSYSNAAYLGKVFNLDRNAHGIWGVGICNWTSLPKLRILSPYCTINLSLKLDKETIKSYLQLQNHWYVQIDQALDIRMQLLPFVELALGVDQRSNKTHFEYPCYGIIIMKLPHIDLGNELIPWSQIEIMMAWILETWMIMWFGTQSSCSKDMLKCFPYVIESWSSSYPYPLLGEENLW